MIVYFVSVWVRMTVPRVRIDQLLNLNWKFLVPLGMIYVIFMAFVLKIAPVPDLTGAQAIAAGPYEGVATGLYRLLGPNFVASLPQAGILLLANVLFVVVTAAILREVAQRRRRRVEDLVDETDYSGAGGAGGYTPADNSEAAAAQ